jgi:hypothetical protein
MNCTFGSSRGANDVHLDVGALQFGVAVEGSADSLEDGLAHRTIGRRAGNHRVAPAW